MKVGFEGYTFQISETIRRFRDYYIQAEETFWDYLPSGENLVDNNNE